MINDERHIRMYGITQAQLQEMGQQPDRLMAAASILSDAQENLEYNGGSAHEGVRQAMNVAKWLVFEERQARQQPQEPPPPAAFNGARCEARGKSTILVALPRAIWKPIEGGCSCLYCSADGRPVPAFWDTLAVPAKETIKDGMSIATPVHAPEVHGTKVKRVAPAACFRCLREGRPRADWCEGCWAAYQRVLDQEAARRGTAKTDSFAGEKKAGS